MKIFIICCLLFIHVNRCIFICGFRVSIRVSGIREFDFGDRFPPELVSGLDSGFDFGFWFWVHRDSTRSESDSLPSLSRGDFSMGSAPENQRFFSLSHKNQPKDGFHFTCLLFFLKIKGTFTSVCHHLTGLPNK